MNRKLLSIGLIALTALSVGLLVLQESGPAGPPVHADRPVALDQTSSSLAERSEEPNVAVPPPDPQPEHPGIVESTGPVLLSEIPEGEFKAGLMRLPQEIQQRVLERLSKDRQLLVDISSIRVDSNGMIYYVCTFDSEAMGTSDPILAASEIEAALNEPVVSATEDLVSSVPVFHSRPGASRILFLDFDGHVIQNTAWNSNTNYNGPVAAWHCLPYSTDSDPDTFSPAEVENITMIWQRVAEDYAPFDVDVTTEQPDSWSSKTGHALITPTRDSEDLKCPHFGLGGVAYIDVFSKSWYSYNYWSGCYSPAWISGEMSASAIAEATSHELGHNLGLHHDGTSSKSYYSGHSNGTISWAPIMGTGYSRDITQWSQGEYYQANNFEDDLLIIKNKLYYRPDDHGNTNNAATAITPGSNGVVMADGVIETTADIDVFSFYAGGGAVTIEVSPYRAPSSTWGGNLDILLSLYSSSGTLMASANPEAEAGASITTNLLPGTYYVHIHPTALGNPSNSPPTGYTDYGVLGQYSIAGAISADADADGMPNVWEMEYFDGNTNAIATMDDDGDLEDNLSEYISGHNPRDASSVFRISSFYQSAPDSSEYIVTWSPVAGRVYNVSWSDSLTNGFSVISGDLPYPIGSYTDSVQRAGSQHYYRIDVRLSP